MVVDARPTSAHAANLPSREGLPEVLQSTLANGNFGERVVPARFDTPDGLSSGSRTH
jgi:hypothetical protein